jgi:hypothetical protein
MGKKRRGSSAGFHYYNLYQNCPRKFYIKSVLRIKPKVESDMLLFGGAFHEGKATFYKTKSKSKALDKITGELESFQGLYGKEETFEFHYLRAPVLLEVWIDTYGKRDLKNFTFIDVEKELRVPLELLEGFYMTVRPDAIVQNKTRSKETYIFETKSTMFSLRVTEEAVRLGDQATSYTWAVRKMYPELNLIGVIPDIAYWHKNAYEPKFAREDLVTRTKNDLREYEIGVSNLIREVSQKVEAYYKGYDPVGLFPRNTSWCLSFSHPCEYAYICRNVDLKPKGRVPRGFLRDKRRTSVVEEVKI